MDSTTSVTINGGQGVVNLLHVDYSGGLFAASVTYVGSANGRDSMMVDDSADATGRTMTLNTGTITGIAGQIDYSSIGYMEVDTGQAADTVNVRATNVNTGIVTLGGDQVWVGTDGSVQGIAAPLTLAPVGYATLSVDDSADTQAHTVTLDDADHGDGEMESSITGLAPAAIGYFDVLAVGIDTGTASDTINILATDKTTYIDAKGGDHVAVGDQGSLQRIAAPLEVDLPFLAPDTLSVDDSADTAVHGDITLDVSDAGSGHSMSTITGLAPATISYNSVSHDNSPAVSVTTGSAADTVNVLASAVTTNLSSGGGSDVVNVGNAGSVQGILSTLNIKNPPWFTALNVDDSADATARTVTLSTFTPIRRHRLGHHERPGPRRHQLQVRRTPAA